MQWIFEPAPRIALPIIGSELDFPVRRVFCVARNYADHAREMGAEPSQDAPFFFTKPAEAVVYGPDVPFPSATRALHHEVELVVALKAGGRHIDPVDAYACIFGYAVGLDLTRRDLQAEAKGHGRPWDAAKSFEGSAPCGAIRPVSQCGRLEQGAIWLDVNGQRRQSGDLAQMIHTVDAVISALSQQFTLMPGDLIMTGTPAGVAALQPGDVLHAGIDRVGELNCRMGPAQSHN